MIMAMTRTGFLIRSILYYWRTNVAVLLGVIAATAVIGGALVVGDSVRDSLRTMSLDRLGRIDHAASSHRFFREELADELGRSPEFQNRFVAVAPALVMEGSFVHEVRTDEPPANSPGESREHVHRAGRVNVFGVDQRLWDLTDHGDVAVPDDGEVVLSQRVGQQLNVAAGDEVTLWIEMPATIPRDSLLGDRDDSVREIPLTVKIVLEEASGVGRLALNPNQQLPLNAFVSLKTLQSYIDLAAARPTRDNPDGAAARVNTLFVAARSPEDQTESPAKSAAEELTALLARHLTLRDLSLHLRPKPDRGYLSLESEQMIVEDLLAQAGESAAAELGLRQSKVLVYLANEIVHAGKSDAYSMYSVVAGLETASGTRFGPAVPPFGPFEFVGDPPSSSLSDGELESGGMGEIVLNEWLAEDLGAQPGDEVLVKYHVVGSHGELPEEVRRFRVRGIVKLDGTPADDRGLTPTVRGITTARTFAEWKQPFPMKLNQATAGDDGHFLTQRDEDYWDAYRATPKAFLTLSAAQHLWESRYGSMTSLRVAGREGQSLDETASEFENALLRSLDPERLGLHFLPVKYDGLQAASGTTDFSGLFFGFSFFLILSAAILIGLLMRLGIERRGANLGLLSAVGYSPGQIRNLFLAEGLIVVGIGGLLGTAAAVGYATLMVYGLKTWWIGAIGTRFLFVSIHPASLALGFGISVAVAAVAVWWALRIMQFLSSRDLLAGATQQAVTSETQRTRGRSTRRLGLTCLVISSLLVGGAITDLVPADEAFFGLSWQVVAFFIVGIALLIAGLSFLAVWLDADKAAAVRGGGAAAMGRLGMRNAARHRQRSVLTVGLIASATFVIVAVAAGQRNPTREEPDLHSGNGGFLLVAESSSPILYDLNTREGRDKLDFRVPDDSSDARLLDKMLAMPFRVKPGEDASCLNLYQTRLPTVLGVTPRMIERGGFKFVGARQENPWTLLNEADSDDGVPVYPVFGDMNTLMYSLHKNVGDEIAIPDEAHPEYKLRIAGMFDGSIFQGVLLMAEHHFQRQYPEQAGYRYFLVGDRRYATGNTTEDAMLAREEAQALAAVLERELTAQGFDTEPVVQRLDSFLAVQNTYLSTFQALGGLGLLLGTLGLATVMVRNVMERRSELALLRAVGFRNTNLAFLVMWENAFLLVWGLLTGTVSALLAMTPHLLSTGADVPWQAGGMLLGGVLIVGMLAALLAVSEAVRTPILATLRSH
jgi:putative ABC transport system permease protein